MKRFNFSFYKSLPSTEFRITFPTCLTILRILLVPCTVIAMLTHAWGYAVVFFLSASMTDMFDGMLARMWNQETFLGACLDPLADKLLIVSCFATLAFTNELPFSVPLWFVLLVLLREMMIVCGFAYLLFRDTGIESRPTLIGKLTTCAHSFFILWLFACYFFRWYPVKTYYGALILISFLVVGTLLQYMKIAFQFYKKVS